jgi:hypothetical protein
MTAFLGIYREPICSPGHHLDNDRIILELAAQQLEARGHRVALSSADAAERAGRDASVVFSMSRSPRCLEMLTRWERDGKTIVNRPAAVLETARDRLAARAFGAVSLPATRVVITARALRDRVGDPFVAGGHWVKGGELFSSRREDVRRVETRDALDRVLDDFERRGIATAVLQEHVEGPEIKFYAVGPGAFFHSLGADEAAGRVPRREFQAPATATGVSVGLEIFGGDIVVRGDGGIVLIDLNDWPSFAPCPDAAACAIAEYLEAKLVDSYALASPVRPAPSA